MQQSPLVSVILPTRNRRSLLGKAIESVFTQSYKNLELIIIDDASTDTTADFLKDIADQNKSITVLRNEINLGIVSSLNKGIAISSGVYIARLDDDDNWSDNQKLQKQVEFLEKNPEYCLVGGGMVKVNATGREIGRYLPPEKDREIRKTLLVNNVFVHTSVLFRKEAFQRAGGYDPKFLHIEDWDLWLKMGTLGKLYNFPDFFVHYLDQEHNNPNYYRNYGIRRNVRLTLSLKKKYKNDYPGYSKAVLLSWCNYLYSFLPRRRQLAPFLLKVKKWLFGAFA